MMRGEKRRAEGRAIYFKADADMIAFLKAKARERRVSLSDVIREVLLQEMRRGPRAANEDLRRSRVQRS